MASSSRELDPVRRRQVCGPTASMTPTVGAIRLAAVRRRVGAGGGRAEQIPARAGVGQPVWFGVAYRVGAVVVLVVEAEPLVLAAGGGDGGQHSWVHRGADGGDRDGDRVQQVDAV